MCIAEQSGICKAGGPAHDHQWQFLSATAVPLREGGVAIQVAGTRDDGQYFFQSATVSSSKDEELMKQWLRNQLDFELNCCLCLGDEHQKEIAV